MNANFEKMVNQIIRVSGFSREEILQKVQEKKDKLSGLISDEGAAQVIAAELGINFDNEKLKISEIIPGLRKVNVVGKVIKIFPIHEFTTKKGEKSKVVNLILADETANIKVVLWDLHHIELIETGKINEEKIIEISNGTIRENEIHLGSFSEFKPSNLILENVKTERIVKEKTISDFKANESNLVRAFVVQTFEPRFFHVCSTCKKKVENADPQIKTGICAEHGNIACEKRAVLNIVIDDGTETIRTVLFHEAMQSIGFKNYENQEAIAQQRQNLLGKEFIFSGNVKTNSFFNNLEFVINEIREPKIEELLEKLK